MLLKVTTINSLVHQDRLRICGLYSVPYWGEQVCTHYLSRKSHTRVHGRALQANEINAIYLETRKVVCYEKVVHEIVEAEKTLKREGQISCP